MDLNVINLLQTAKHTEKLNIYCIHAIGGTIYPYYSMLKLFPNYTNVYGVFYNQKLPYKTLEDLAKSYAEQVNKVYFL